jgi:formylglycine-generating enzyme required for sulfatase activity
MKHTLTLFTALLLVSVAASQAVEPPGKPVDSLVLQLGGDVTMKFVKVPVGTFLMGVAENAPDRDKQNMPEREVTIDKAFWIGTTEVTQTQYATVMGDNPSKSSRDPQCPVDTVTPKQVDEFCKKLSAKTGKTARMPSESEWEYAARAGSDGLGGAKLADVAWFQSNSEAKPHPVGTKLPNAWGLYDMLGNANEWTRGEKWIGYRGGCWRTPERKSKPTHREGHGNLHSDPYGGFRVVLDAQ